MAQNIEQQWRTKAGFLAVVLMNDMGFRCGYVAVGKGHPLHGHDYNVPTDKLKRVEDGENVGDRGAIPIFCAALSGDDSWRERPEIVFNVHGSLTYSGDGGGKYPIEHDGLWWFGYDCGHCDDAPAPGSRLARCGMVGGVHRSLQYCVEQCESLAQQLIDRVKFDTGMPILPIETSGDGC